MTLERLKAEEFLPRLQLQPVTLREANLFVRQHHRHLGQVRGCLFCVGVNSGGEVVGVAIVGRPAARLLQDGYTAEVSRCCTVGTRNACSMLYAAAWRACRAIGYRRLITYTLDSESGSSIKAAGFRELYRTTGGSWNRRERPRVDGPCTGQKRLFERSVTG